MAGEPFAYCSCRAVSVSGTAIAALARQGKLHGNTKHDTSKRERLDTPTGRHFAKRTGKGQFKEMDNVGRSLKADRRTKAKRAVKSGQ